MNQVLTHAHITIKAQRTDALLMTYKGRTQTLKKWSKEYGVKYTTARTRFLKGWNPVQVLS